MSYPLYPIFYGTPVQLYSVQGWVSDDGTISWDAQRAASFAFLNSSLSIPTNENGDPRFVSYGDTVVLVKVPEGAFVGLEPNNHDARVLIGAPPSMQPLLFSVQPAAGQPSGQPLSAYNRDQVAASHVNAIFLQTATWGTVYVPPSRRLELSITNATSFHVSVCPDQLKTKIALPQPLPRPYSFPSLPVNRPLPPWQPPFIPLIPVPPMSPMFPSCLQISSSEAPPANVICLLKNNSFCMPRWLATIVLIFAIVTLFTVLASKLVK